MKINNLSFLSLIAITAVTLSSCDLLKDVTYSVSPNPLELHGDNVKIAVFVNFNPISLVNNVTFTRFNR